MEIHQDKPPMALTIGSLLGGLFGIALTQMDRKTLESIDIFNRYYTFPREHNNAIDQLLMDPRHGKMGNQILVSPTVSIPGVGYHYLYRDLKSELSWWEWIWSALEYVMFEKTMEVIDRKEVYTYRAKIRCWSTWVGMDIPRDKLALTDAKQIQTIHVDGSSYQPQLVSTMKSYGTPRPVQAKLALDIATKFNQTQNVKVLLSGMRGSGKSYLASVVKKQIDQTPGVDALLFDDVSPCMQGLDIPTLILSRASRVSPAILVIDEFDVVLDETVKVKSSFEPRNGHTTNKSTLNSLLDAIEHIPM